jgi:chromosome segregation ATPase
VAGELKERRFECRDLASKIEELEQANDKLEEHIAALGSKLSDRDRCGSEKDEEVGQLRSTIEDLERQLKQSEKKLKAQETSFENDLTAYKRKAQNSLAVANARAASAIQAKEEAYLEAQAARSTAASMMDRARVAEANGEKAMVEAKKYYEVMEEAKEKAVAELEVATNELETVNKSLADSLENLNRITAAKEDLAEECSRRSRDLETERSKLNELQLEIAETKIRARDLQNDATELRGQLQKARAAADAKSTSMSDEAPSPTSVHAPVEDTNSRATLMMLQKQLAEANAQIDELKELMHNALTSEKLDGVGYIGTSQQSPGNENGSKGHGGAPLFYAIEKQAELNTARNEINRLASLYSNLQSEKFEAQEALETARRELDEERAKLGRYEKLNQSEASSNTGSPTESDANAGRMNIEYLKNIVMRYLGAKTLAEKKALIPVISAVLCLTPDEQAKAMLNVDSSVGVEGFGMALFESFGSRVGR